MDESVLWIITGGACVLFISMALALILFWREHQRLKKEVQRLDAQLQRSGDDLVGLCSAAVAVDKRLALQEARLNGVQENTTAPPPVQPETVREEKQAEQPPEQGYEFAIEKIRQGASVEDLVKSCGLTRDEAVLLVRLHGNR